jgi:hypothetical protein
MDRDRSDKSDRRIGRGDLMSHISLMSQRREGETGGNRSESTSVTAVTIANCSARGSLLHTHGSAPS